MAKGNAAAPYRGGEHRDSGFVGLSDFPGAERGHPTLKSKLGTPCYGWQFPHTFTRVPVTSKTLEFLNKPQDASAPYYQAIIVEKEDLLRFAEGALAHGLPISLKTNGEQRSRFMLLKSSRSPDTPAGPAAAPRRLTHE
jgi:hypothetical protein